MSAIDFAALVASLPAVDAEQREREEAERAARLEERRAASERRRRVEVVSALPVRREIIDAIVDDAVVVRPALATVRAWRDSRKARTGKATLMLLGGAGCGKTVAAAWAIANTRGAEYLKMQALSNLYRAGFGEDHERFQRLLSTSLLVVDELTTERDIELGRAALHEVIDERQSRDRATILIANRTKKEIAERYDPRTIDRLREGATVCSFEDKSMRKGTW